MLLRMAVTTLLCLSFSTAEAKRSDAPNQEMERLEVARSHFASADQLFAKGQFADALVEYEMAHLSLPSQSVDLQVARCYEALGANELAIEAYERYMAANPGGRDADDARVRVAALKTKAPAPIPVAAAPRKQGIGFGWVAPALVGGVVLAAFTTGGVLVGTTRGDADRLATSCAPYCAPPQVDLLRTRQTAGFVLIGVGAVAAATEAVLWVLAFRHFRERRALVAPTVTSHSAGLSIAGSF